MSAEDDRADRVAMGTRGEDSRSQSPAADTGSPRGVGQWRVFELSAGQIVADKYRIDGVLGTGGMGVVVAATHVELEQRVAIKFLREVSPEALARFQREARMLVRLKSPHVARVIDVGAMDDDTPYIVMEHLDGSDLATIASERKKLPVEETVDYILQACEAVAEAHALGMVHRDLKPANLFLARGPGGTTTVKVLDFGVSKILDDRTMGSNDATRGGDLTNEGVALGSPGYMSPEQMTSARDVDERSDIFSLGALLYRLGAGQPPYKGTSVVTILAVMATEKLPSLRNYAPDAPEGFAAIVARCLANDKVMRFPSVAHLAHALEPYATRRGRVSIEQILATLNVTISDDGVGAAMRAEVVAPMPTPRQTAPTVMERTQELPREARLGSSPTGPHFTVSAPAAAPPSFVSAPVTARKGAWHLWTLVIALLLVGICGVAWRVLRNRSAVPAPVVTAVTVPVPVGTAGDRRAGSAPATATATVETSATAIPSATEVPAASASSEIAPRPRVGRPRGHTTAPRVATPPTNH
ncbi:MAG: Serine/threonine-protein kinase pkn3 [Myxococcaceae bacterium]|nr:Serine/threonine-protein kinase pkn3 [Myxococcaceae bacterium]